jgi:hypothetical protein
MVDFDKVKFGIKIDEHSDGVWSFGTCLSHYFDETYLYINLFKYTVSIGFLYKDIYK